MRPCPLCRSHDSHHLFLGIRRCGHCRLRFVSPLGNYRGENETEEYFLKEYLPIHENNRETSIAERRSHLELIQRTFPLPPNPKLLDVGCALGFMLREARTAGWEAVGVETSEFAARYAREYSGCEVHRGNLQQIGFHSQSFDVVTLMDVIEHVPEPLDLVAEIRRVLRPNGVLFIVTPNFRSFFARLYGPNAYGIGPEEHLTYFERSTLFSLLQFTGYRNITCLTKDVYAENLRRLFRKSSDHVPEIKARFGRDSRLSSLRSFFNRVFVHVPLGDKLVAMAQA